jgi:hypothetical protein
MREREGGIWCTAADLLAPLLDEAELGAVRVAQEWLADALAKGPHLAEDVVCKAREQGIAERTLKRAKHHPRGRLEKGAG